MTLRTIAFLHFTSIISKESNFYDREISDYAKGQEIEKESERIEISIIELEHDIWLSFTRGEQKK